MSPKANENRLIGYPLRWPAWMAERVAEAATARGMSVATWLREAALEKLERAGQSQPPAAEVLAVKADERKRRERPARPPVRRAAPTAAELANERSQDQRESAPPVPPAPATVSVGPARYPCCKHCKVPHGGHSDPCTQGC